jgi:hypothetical protein
MNWVREGAGWLLVLLGLVMFAVVHDYCERRWMFEAAIMAVSGIFVFRGGIHLLKVSIAARIAGQAQDQLYPTPPRRSEAVSASRPPAASS